MSKPIQSIFALLKRSQANQLKSQSVTPMITRLNSSTEIDSILTTRKPIFISTLPNIESMKSMDGRILKYALI